MHTYTYIHAYIHTCVYFLSSRQEEMKQKALENLELLKAMGFADEVSNRELLRMHRGDVSKVCVHGTHCVRVLCVCVRERERERECLGET
jgi:hypothetical protein